MRSHLRAVQSEFTQIARRSARLAMCAARDETRAFLEWIRPAASDRVLDAACGSGRLARALERRAKQVVGIDLCPAALALARDGHSRPAAQTLWVAGDVARLPCPDAAFDLITCAYAFANLRRPLQVLDEFARLLAPRGRLALIDVVAPEDPERRACFNQLEALRSRCYTRLLAYSQFLRLFGRAGLELHSSEIHRRRCSARDWLVLSPAASNPGRARRLRRLLEETILGDRAGLSPRRNGGDIIFHYTTAWFLLEKQSVLSRQSNKTSRRQFSVFSYQ
jgi:ubiquinone/menaquinone biosynthesis C-methylase UbiE